MLVKASGVVIKNGNNKFLLQLRTADAPSWKNQWILFGGHAEGKETPIQTAIRELEEELGILFGQERMAYLEKMFLPDDEGNPSEYSLFKMSIKPEEKIKPGEGANYDFFTKEEALKLPVPPFMIAIIEKYF